MKKRLNGSLCDTQKARRLYNYNNGKPFKAVDYIEETLYQNKAGVYFIHAIGGPETLHAKMVGALPARGENLIAMTDREAKIWGKKRMDSASYKKIFSPDEAALVKLSMDVPKYIADKMDKIRSYTSESRGELVSRLIDEQPVKDPLQTAKDTCGFLEGLYEKDNLRPSEAKALNKAKEAIKTCSRTNLTPAVMAVYDAIIAFGIINMDQPRISAFFNEYKSILGEDAFPEGNRKTGQKKAEQEDTEKAR